MRCSSRFLGNPDETRLSAMLMETAMNPRTAQAARAQERAALDDSRFVRRFTI
jgi:hypothetical protein